ncbi:MAG: hypothetical protein HC922_10090 [Leptolyngbyaceae cyanobacterium SM2_3_12]|nr:hypothetical protein [Leptolyngbyaceae cyanobacterium SM2_3_12]
MAKSRKLEATLAKLEVIRADPSCEMALDTLRQVLDSPYSVAVAQAAKLVQTAELYALTPDLVTTFERLMVDPVKKRSRLSGQISNR